MRALKYTLVSFLSLIRVPLAIACVYFLFRHEWAPSAICFLLSAATDIIDGPLARRWDMVTTFGSKADLWSDVALFYLWMGSWYVYSQVYSPWWQEHLPPMKFIAILVSIAILVTIWIRTTQVGAWFAKQWVRKWNFWTGVTPDAAFGCWIAYRAGMPYLVALIAYGLLAICVNRDKIATKI